jgi:hypothetical protein
VSCDAFVFIRFLERCVFVIFGIFLFFVIAQGLGRLLPDIYDYDAEARFLQKFKEDPDVLSEKKLSKEEVFLAIRKGYRENRLLSYYMDCFVRFICIIFAISVSLTTTLTWFKTIDKRLIKNGHNKLGTRF